MLSVQYVAAAAADDEASRLYELCLGLTGTENCKFYSGINVSC